MRCPEGNIYTPFLVGGALLHLEVSNGIVNFVDISENKKLNSSEQ